MEHGTDLALEIALLLGLGAFCQWAAWRLRIAAILPLLLAGLVLGPVSGVFDPDRFLGELLFPVVSLGVAIILFEGSLTLRLSEISSVTGIIRNLTTLGVIVTWAVMGAAAYFIAGLDLYVSALFGALVTVTGPTVIVPMLRSIRPTERIANILRWEGIIVDPIGAVLAVLVFELIISGQEGQSLLEFAKVIMFGSVWGIAGGFVLGRVLERHLLPDYLDNYAALAFVLLVFTTSNALGQESGLIAVTVMGIVLANTKDLDVEDLLSFKEHLTVVVISMLFILLAARLDLDQLMAVGAPALIILGVALFVARPLAVLVSSIGNSLSFREGVLLAWIAPRGIVAAAISSLFALQLEDDVANAAMIVPLTFAIIIGTVLVQSLTAGWLASRLGLSSRGDQGVLIAGANRVSLAIGEALHENDIRVLMADTTREGLNEARMKGLSIYYGNPLSEHADRYMDLTGYTELLALSRNPEANAMICARFRHEFGNKHVFSVQPSGGEEDNLRKELALGLRANILFGRDVTWKKLASLLGQGAQIKSTRLSEEFDFEAFSATRREQSINLFALNEKGRLKVFSNFEDLNPEPGWTIISLTTETTEERAREQRAKVARKEKEREEKGDRKPDSGEDKDKDRDKHRDRDRDKGDGEDEADGGKDEGAGEGNGADDDTGENS